MMPSTPEDRVGHSEDSYRKIALDAIAALYSEEIGTEQEFGIGNPDENYHEESDALKARLAALDAGGWTGGEMSYCVVCQRRDERSIIRVVGPFGSQQAAVEWAVSMRVNRSWDYTPTVMDAPTEAP